MVDTKKETEVFWLEEELAAIRAIKEEDLICPSTESTPYDENIEHLTFFERQIWTRCEMLQKEAKHLRVDLESSRSSAQREHFGFCLGMVRGKLQAFENIFWTQVRINHKIKSYSLGIRSDWSIVRMNEEQVEKTLQSLFSSVFSEISHESDDSSVFDDQFIED
ncbi:TPA: hypothetical protein DCG61_02625 [Patescibacteria group bacterium]|jgi:hypothetical protein|nr:hypothetical protein [Patescibacteria group bacterium]